MSMHTTQLAPSMEVLAAFGLPGVAPRLLADGRGTSWSVTSAILKPVDDPVEVNWVAELFTGLEQRGFRLPQPIRSNTGQYGHEGWCAWQYIPGSHDNHGDWDALLAACVAFHEALRGIDPPGFLATPRHHWAQADRIAWGEERPGERWGLLDSIRGLQERISDADKRLPRQLIHGDFAGNVLYEPGHEPGVIDFSPYYRPAPYALAITVADAIAWMNAPAGLLGQARAHGVTDSLVLRAVVFRLSAACASPDGGIDDRYSELSAYSKVLALLGK